MVCVVDDRLFGPRYLVEVSGRHGEHAESCDCLEIG